MKTIILLCTLIASTCTQFAHAETWFVGTLASYHYSGDDRGKYEQQNWGIGLEQRLTGSFAVVGGMYRNSNRRDSLYVGAAWTPWKWGNVGLGTSALLVSGYETTKKPELVKALIPFLSFEFGGVGINVPIIPPTSSNAGAVGLQVKWKF